MPWKPWTARSISWMHRHQETARHLIKALAVLKLYGKSTNNGATVEELANTLLLLPENKMLEAADEIELVLNNLRQVTDGQFINRSSEGYYYLDLDLTIDYDQVIARKAGNLPENALDDEILAEYPERSAGTACRRRKAVTAIPTAAAGLAGILSGKVASSTRRARAKPAAPLGDYQFVFLSPFCEGNRYTASAKLPSFQRQPRCRTQSIS
jgi:hypothetical protein